MKNMHCVTAETTNIREGIRAISKDQEGIWRLMSSGTLASFSQFDFPAFIADMF